MSTTMIRWRRCDPAEEGKRYRPGAANWTRVHRLQALPPGGTEWTRCGLEVPAFPYVEDRDEQVPEEAPRCKRCAQLEVAP